MATLTESLSRLTGKKEGLDVVRTLIVDAFGKIDLEKAAAEAEINTVIAQLQGGVANFRATTPTDDASNTERDAGQRAVIGAIKAGKDLSEDEAKACWREAALASRPTDRQWLLCDPDGLIQEYAANLGLKGWDEFKAWIVRTPVEEMGL